MSDNTQNTELNRREVLRSVGAGATLSVSGSAIDLTELPLFNRTVRRQGFEIRIVSSQPDLVSGGDARVRVILPKGTAPSDVQLLANGTDVTDHLESGDDNTIEGVVEGLAEGTNTLELRNKRATVARLTVVNHPQTGPMFSGEQQQPFGCALDNFDILPALDQANPGDPTDCEAIDRVDYVYKSSTDGSFKPLDPADSPTDIATTETTDGKTVDYIVRVERGTINRFIYSLAMLAPDETSPDAPDYSAWNDKLIYVFEGGVDIGHQQGDPDEDDMLFDLGLGRGYAVVYSTGTKTDTHYDLQVGGETALMVKEEFVERHGEPEYTVGVGGSGGAIQQYVYGQNHPELLDAAIPSYSYPDMVTQTIHIGDCELLEFYMDVLSGNQVWDDWDNRQWLEGLNSEADVVNEWTRTTGASECVNSWRGLNQITLNPFFAGRKTGLDFGDNPELLTDVEWTHWADLKQVYGLDQDGFARRTWDNVGVQYGLHAFREGKISAEEFLRVNEQIGSWKETRNMVPPGLPFNPNADEPDPYGARNMNLGEREEGSIEAMKAAYEEGIVFHGDLDIPIIDWRPYLEEVLDMHHSRQSFAARQRLIDWNGHADNQVIWFIEPFEDGAPSLYPRALEVMDEWMQNVQANPNKPVGQVRPKGAVDACFESDGTPIAMGEDVWEGILEDRDQGRGNECGKTEDAHPGTLLSDDACGACAEKFTIYTSSRIVAGGPIAGNVFKCQTKSVEEALNDGTYGDWEPTEDQVERLKAIFPDGVCDYSKPDAGLPEKFKQRMHLDDVEG